MNTDTRTRPAETSWRLDFPGGHILEFEGPSGDLDASRLTKWVDTHGNETTYDDSPIPLPDLPADTHTTEFRYDAHGRLTRVVYPDGSVVSYRHS